MNGNGVQLRRSLKLAARARELIEAGATLEKAIAAAGAGVGKDERAAMQALVYSPRDSSKSSQSARPCLPYSTFSPVRSLN